MTGFFTNFMIYFYYYLGAAARALGLKSGKGSSSSSANGSHADVESEPTIGTGATDPHRRKAMCEQMQGHVCTFLEGPGNRIGGMSDESRSIATLSSWFHSFMLFLIIINVLLVLIETVKDITDVTGHTAFDIIEWTSVAIFTGEFVARVFSAPANPKYHTGEDNKSMMPCGCFAKAGECLINLCL